MRVSTVLGACTLGLATMSGCSAYIERGETLYREGRYVEAAEVFELTEQRLAASSETVQAEYGLYRGLTFLRLDDLGSARQWLGYANAVEQRCPEALETSQHLLLDRGWSELEQRSRAEPLPRRVTEQVAETDLTGGARGASLGNGRRSVTPP